MSQGIDEPGPVFVVIPALSLLNSTSTSLNSAISRANAIRVKTTAKSATNDEIMPMTGMVANSQKKNAKNVAMVAGRRRKKNRQTIKMETLLFKLSKKKTHRLDEQPVHESTTSL